MTRRDERRAECARAIMTCMDWRGLAMEEAFTIIDSLHGIARLVPIRTTKTMDGCDAVNEVYDLTNPPEKKP
jgi:hypothetical protein